MNFNVFWQWQCPVCDFKVFSRSFVRPRDPECPDCFARYIGVRMNLMDRNGIDCGDFRLLIVPPWPE